MSFSDADDLIITSAPINQRQYTIAFWLETTGPGGMNPRIAAPIGTLYDWVLINREISLISSCCCNRRCNIIFFLARCQKKKKSTDAVMSFRLTSSTLASA